MSSYDDIDITSVAFTRRLAALLTSHRIRNKQYLWRLSRHSDGRFSVDDLQDIEAGRFALDEATIHAVTELYGATIESLLPPRVRLQISQDGSIGANGVEKSFDPHDQTSMLAAYLELIRTLRDRLDATVIELRREDVEMLADHLQALGSEVVTELAVLMGANERERRAMSAMFIAGASVISVSTPSKRTPTPANALRSAAGDHPTRYHVEIPERSTPDSGTVTVLADWQRGSST